MPEFRTTKGIASEIENIIRTSKREIVLVSPYLQINKIFYERLGEASQKKIPITMIYGKDELKESDRESLYKLDYLRLYYYSDLHAKCYYNEEKLLITSMNMYEFSEINNREMGVLIESDKDKELYKDAVEEVQSILHISVEKKGNINGFEQEGRYRSWNSKNAGYCIRCESRIEYNPNKPYCSYCFNRWRQFQNIFYTENVCHNCGNHNSTSMEKPECWNCFSNN